ncbi:iron complex transport system permease protein [Actinoplanes lutulentus]|uniref:Iron complex transport system permease protein n=1 Tax=Actinoplanes lutulentus TaxID=1287878 RepID=A0A327ZL51_9ACTN|nr:iron complex transport system permease protein [Actinoplanes lutulentus]
MTILSARPAIRRASSSRRFIALALAGVVLLIAVVASVALGARPVPLGHVWAALTDYDGSSDAVAVRDLRLPRTLLGVFVGAALGVAGCLMQALTRNPLAEPGVLGVNAGAAAAIVSAMSFLGVTAPAGYVWFAMAGAGGAFALVYLLGGGGRIKESPARLAVAGTAVGAALTGFTSAVVLFDSTAFDQFRFWAVGALADRGMPVFWQVAPFLAGGLLLAASIGPALNTLALGDDQSRSLGSNPLVVRGTAALAAVALSAGATAAAGPIGFVGLAVPHAARFIVGADERWLMAFSALAAPSLLLIADVTGRVLGRPGELETGVVTAMVGAPLFIYLVRRLRVPA